MPKFNEIPSLEEWKRASSSLRGHALSPKLALVDALVERYHRDHSAKLKNLDDLQNAIVAWARDRTEQPVDCGEVGVMEALDSVVRHYRYLLEGWGRPGYLNAVCFGYVVKTSNDSFFLGTVPQEQRDSEELADIDARCGELTTAIQLAFSHWKALQIPSEEDNRILKIFMAPEFLFRGPNGAYAKDRSDDIFEKLSHTTSAFRNWLFVLGTAVCCSSAMGDGVTGVRLRNLALVQQGGMKGAKGRFKIEKELRSGSDFSHAICSAGFDTGQVMIAGSAVTPLPPPRSSRASELDGGCCFIIDSNLLIGLEVCLDHGRGRLRDSDEGGKVLIQLIPSCGMCIQNKSISCVSGGIVFNVDGFEDGSGIIRPHMQVRIRDNPTLSKDWDTEGIHMTKRFKIPWSGLATHESNRRFGIPLADLQRYPAPSHPLPILPFLAGMQRRSPNELVPGGPPLVRQPSPPTVNYASSAPPMPPSANASAPRPLTTPHVQPRPGASSAPPMPPSISPGVPGPLPRPPFPPPKKPPR